MATLFYNWLSLHADRTPNKMAWVDLHSDRSFTFAQAENRAARLAGWLHANGVTKGDRVGTLMMNSTDMVEVYTACVRIGAVFLPLNWRLTQPELQFIINDAEPSMLIHDHGFRDIALAVVAGAPGAPRTLETTADGGDSGFETAISTAQPAPVDHSITHDDIACIMYTSGTTGRPKGAINTFGMAVYNAINMGFPVSITPASTGLTVLPLFHTGGLNCYFSALLHAGAGSLIMREFDPGAVLALINDPARNITHFFGVPANYLFMSQHPDFAKTDFSRIVTSGIGGAPTPVPLLETYKAQGMALSQGYGMTETSPTVFVQDAEMAFSRPGSTGKRAMHTAVKIVDADGAEVGPDEVGELLVKGPNITPGYWRRPEATAEAIVDGWLHTGDACRKDANGHYWIVDRWKDMYISGGENVYPAEVESLIFKIPGVADAAILGLPDDRWGETGCAVIVRAAGADLSASDVIGFCRGKLATFKIPTRVEFTDELPRNATGKVLKRVLKERLT